MNKRKLSQFRSKAGKKGGANGTGKAKARTTEQARAAALARWGKRKFTPREIGLAKIANGKTAKMTESENAAVDRIAIKGLKFKSVKLKAPKRIPKRKVSPTMDVTYLTMVPNYAPMPLGGE